MAFFQNAFNICATDFMMLYIAYELQLKLLTKKNNLIN